VADRPRPVPPTAACHKPPSPTCREARGRRRHTLASRPQCDLNSTSMRPQLDLNAARRGTDAASRRHRSGIEAASRHGSAAAQRPHRPPRQARQCIDLPRNGKPCPGLADSEATARTALPPGDTRAKHACRTRRARRATTAEGVAQARYARTGPVSLSEQVYRAPHIESNRCRPLRSNPPSPRSLTPNHSPAKPAQCESASAGRDDVHPATGRRSRPSTPPPPEARTRSPHPEVGRSVRAWPPTRHRVFPDLQRANT